MVSWRSWGSCGLLGLHLWREIRVGRRRTHGHIGHLWSSSVPHGRSTSVLWAGMRHRHLGIGLLRHVAAGSGPANHVGREPHALHITCSTHSGWARLLMPHHRPTRRDLLEPLAPGAHYSGAAHASARKPHIRPHIRSHLTHHVGHVLVLLGHHFPIFRRRRSILHLLHLLLLMLLLLLHMHHHLRRHLSHVGVHVHVVGSHHGGVAVAHLVHLRPHHAHLHTLRHHHLLLLLLLLAHHLTIWRHLLPHALVWHHLLRMLSHGTMLRWHNSSSGWHGLSHVAARSAHSVPALSS